jgi:hypothetical protein
MAYAPQALGNWPNSQFGNVRVLLGCEMTGLSTNMTQQIHVVPSSNSVIVRYVFLFTQGAAIPFRKHIEPAMSSAYAALWSGVG